MKEFLSEGNYDENEAHKHFYHEQIKKFQSQFQYMCPSLTGATSSQK